MKLLISLSLFILSWNTLISEDYKRIGVNYSNTIGIYSLSPNLSDKSDIFQSIERYSVSYYSDIELRHLLENTKVVIKLGYSKYSLSENANLNEVNSIDLQVGLGDKYTLHDIVVFYYYVGSQISYIYNAPVNFPMRTANSFPFISSGLLFNIFNDLELKIELQSGLFSYRLLGVIPSYEMGLVWRY
ncbi:MAG: hypothetical protein CVV25_07630 [Ignavibacteriae bacterium HGW-Ignavibacteriae-4]|jgi:hypothetical protein|nr:MAG: hypothetical protein CVV25_07630 [Ignavibacteriae bacterium HGW-Ignavibacteriae-4]